MAEKYVALTFDDGPNDSATPAVLDVLEKHGVKGSFFLVGNNITDSTSCYVKRAFEMGCDICNHSRSHPAMTELSPEEMLAEIGYTSEKIVGITGQAPKYFRPPYIAVNELMHETIDLTFICGCGCNDWDVNVSVQERFDMTMSQVQNGTIILLHDAENNFATVEALEMIITSLKEHGYEMVTVSELFEKCGTVPQRGKMYSNVIG